MNLLVQIEKNSISFLFQMTTKTLVTVQEILSIRRHVNADRLCVAKIQGYDVIINPESFGETMQTFEKLVGEKGVMFYIDSVIPDEYEKKDVFSFLSGKRVRTIKIRKEYSQGLFLSFESVRDIVDLNPDLPVGTDLTDEFKVVKYYDKEDNEKPTTNTTSKSFPEWFPKTDQPRLQERINILQNCPNRKLVATIKVDGQSATFFHNNETKETGMCSRNYQLTDIPNQFKTVNAKYSILEKLSNYMGNIAVQGELYGSGINGNRLQLTTNDFIVFDVYEWNERGGKYWPHDKVVQFCKEYDLPVVPTVLTTTSNYDLKDWLHIAESQTYDQISPKKGLLAEGIVVKTCDDETPYVSFKVISRLYLEKHNL